MTEIVLSQLPPSINRLHRANRGRVHKSSKYQDWLVSSGYEIIAQRPENVAGPYKLSVQLKRPDRRRRDIDNFAFKAISDLLKTVGVVDDDCRAEMISARWVTSGPPVTIQVEKAGVE